MMPDFFSPDERILDIDELEDKIRDYSYSVSSCSNQQLAFEIEQFLNFLERQPIAKRLHERIEEDFGYINEQIPKIKQGWRITNRENFLSLIKTKVHQGALGYFIIKQLSEIEGVHWDFYLETVYRIYDCSPPQYTSDYDYWKDEFNAMFFNPFIHLMVDWYIEESKSKDERDYYSRLEINEISDKINELLNNVQMGQEILFDELTDQKDLLKTLTKKSWTKVLKGNLLNIALGKAIDPMYLSNVYEKLSGEELNIAELIKGGSL